MKTFDEIYAEAHARKFGKQTAQPAPAGPDGLALELKKAVATAEPPPALPVTPARAADDGSDEREVVCPDCGHKFVADYQTDSSTSSTTEDDPDNGEDDDLDETPVWDKTASPGLSWRTRKATAGERRSLKRD
jgi:hypothetical protein